MSGNSMFFEPPDTSEEKPELSPHVRPRLPRPGNSLANRPPQNNKNCFNKEQSVQVKNRLGARLPQPQNNLQNHFNSNRKRVHDNMSGPPYKRRWNYNNQQRNNYNPPFSHSNPNNNQNAPQNRGKSVQYRLQRFKEQNESISSELCPEDTPMKPEDDLDATDITVQVVNNNAPASNCKEEMSATRFKMILNPRVQRSIQVIQQKRKDKQVIIPSAVTPNTTTISMNARFGSL